MSLLTAAFVSILIAVFVYRAIVVRKTFHFEAPWRIPNVTRLTLTGSRVIQNGANSVETTVNQRARIGAIMLDASLWIGTICVYSALVRNYTTCSHRITSCALWADAAIRSMKIDALCARVTRLIVTLVDVQTVFWSSNESVAASKEKNLQLSTGILRND